MNPMPGSRPELVYENDATIGAHMIAFFAVGTLVLSWFLAWYVFSTLAWGGAMAPLSQRIGWAAIIAVGGMAFFSWVWVHNHKVTQRIYYRAVDDMLVLEHPVPFAHRTREVPMTALERANFHPGDPRGERRVNLPWVRIGVHHGRSFIVNLPGHVQRYDVFARMLQSAGLDPQEALIKQAWVEQHG